MIFLFVIPMFLGDGGWLCVSSRCAVPFIVHMWRENNENDRN